MTKLLLNLVLVLVAGMPAEAMSQATSPVVFALSPSNGENAVLQAGQPLSISGSAPPGVEILIDLAGIRATSKANSAGVWRAILPPPAGYGPFVLTARLQSGEVATARGLMIGEVWLCGGQSNMEMSVAEQLATKADYRGTSLSQIRELRILPTAAGNPQSTLPPGSRWLTADSQPEAFSAACFFFALERMKKINRAVGLVNFAVGSSSIQAWSSIDDLRSIPGLSADIARFERYRMFPLEAAAEWGELLRRQWEREHIFSDVFVSGDRGWSKAPAEVLGVDGNYRQSVTAGQVNWYRFNVRLSAEQIAKAKVLSAGEAVGAISLWINGHCVSFEVPPGRKPVSLPINAGVFRPGENEVLISNSALSGPAVLEGHLAGMGVKLSDDSIVPFSQDVQIRTFDGMAQRVIYPPWNFIYGLSVLSNAMLRPLSKVPAAGLVWYQGEGNTRDSDMKYGRLLRAILDSVRNGRQADFRTIVVQLPRFSPDPPTQSSEGWALVREAQRAVVSDMPSAYLVVTSDLPASRNLHPKNKAEIGHRIADAASALDSKSNLAGGAVEPILESRSGSLAVLRLKARGVLQRIDRVSELGIDICDATSKTCRPASVSVDSDGRMLVDGLTASTDLIRYCWGDAAPACGLKSQGQPISPFKIAVPH